MNVQSASELFSRSAAILSIAGLGARAIAAATDAAAFAGTTPFEQALADGAIDETAAYRALAITLRLPFSDTLPPLGDDASWPDAANAGIVPLAPSDRGWRFALAPRGAILERLLAHDQPSPNGLVVTTPSRLAADLASRRRATIGLVASDRLPDASPRDSCRDGPGARFIATLLALLLAVAFGMIIDARATVLSASAALSALFAVTVAIRLGAVMTRPLATPPLAPADRALPVYTILAPLYREAKSARRLVAALRALDYPPAKLDVKFLLETDDSLTLEALHASNLAPWMEIVIVPPGTPNTKPRALNVGLATARGAFLAVYDAEDRPDPQQLRDAVASFAQAPAHVSCLQARIAIENAQETWITRFFAIEYATLFGLIVPSLAAQHLPIPLGGTSNHFRVATLRAVGAWDGWNVTEDADLGLRLFRRGYRVGALDSTTWEEAPITIGAWMRQRTRWQKGWMQTSAVHLVAPRRAIADLGGFAVLCSLATSLGVVLASLLGPTLAYLALAEAASGLPRLQAGALQPGPLTLWSFALALLATGLVAMIAPAGVAVRQQRVTGIAWLVPLLPLYYCLVSIAAWAAVVDIIFRPHHWRKTEHGLSKMLSES